MSSRPIMIMAGGTGGHVYPALAVAQRLIALGQDVVWLGTRNGLEARVIPEHGIPILWISVAGLRGKGVVSWLTAPFKLIRALFQSLAVLRRINPRVVVGMGGFASGPGGLAAWITRRPLVIHEQNAVAGLTNRVLARFAARVLEAFPRSFAGTHAKAETLGNPVRRDIIALPGPAQRLANRQGPLRLLILGGSQGALHLNRVVPAALAMMPDSPALEIKHQSGDRTLDEAVAAYREHRVDAQIVPFIDDMSAAYGWADLVICRAGALTVFELAAAGLGAVLVPFPAATDDHQTKNAEWLAQNSAGVLMPENELSAKSLAELLARLLSDRDGLLKMAANARRLAAPDACERVAEICMRPDRRGVEAGS